MFKKGYVGKGNEEVINVIYCRHTALGGQSGCLLTVADSFTGAWKTFALGLCFDWLLRQAHFCPWTRKSLSR